MFTATIFDTETPGFRSPGIMQLAAVNVDENFDVVGTFSTLIAPQFYEEVEEGAYNIHGISKENCEDYGIPLQTALGVLKNMMNKTEVDICHNYAYDSRVVEKCCNLLERESILARRRRFCTMEALTPICKLPGARNYKWPKLQEAHQFLFGEYFEDAHDALADVLATVKILKEIKNQYPELLRAA